jgi:hypothetical protein
MLNVINIEAGDLVSKYSQEKYNGYVHSYGIVIKVLYALWSGKPETCKVMWPNGDINFQLIQNLKVVNERQ